MSEDRTGMCRGQLRPIIYFISRDGYKILAAYDEGRPEMAKWIYEKKFKPEGWAWAEASTWPEWVQLQDDLIKQETRDAEANREKYMAIYDAGRKRQNAVLMQVRRSSSTSQYERDFIDAWLKLAEEKRKAHEKAMFDKINYLWAIEMDPSTKFQDRVK